MRMTKRQGNQAMAAVLVLLLAINLVEGVAKQRSDTSADKIIVLHGSGTTNLSLFLWKTMQILQAQSMFPVRMTYRAVGSGTGQYEYIGAENPSGNYTSYTHFGAGDIPLSEEDYQMLKENDREPVHIPVAMGAISFFYNIPGMQEDNVKLNLTACQVAKMFRRNITTWDHPDILENNPSLTKYVQEYEPIRVARRVDGSSSTASVTDYLYLACPSVWPEDLVGKSIEWPEDTIPAEGSGGVTQAIKNVNHTIGYVDSSFGREHGLVEAALQLHDGEYKTSEFQTVSDTVMEALAEGMIPEDFGDSFANVTLIDLPGPDAWPIVTLSYIYLDNDLTPLGDAGPLLKAMLQYILSDEVQGSENPYLENALISKIGLQPLPQKIKEMAKDKVEDLETSQANPTWAFESGSNTIKGLGALPFVFSGKRQDHYSVALQNLLNDLNDLKNT